jgi:hypothetical protein
LCCLTQNFRQFRCCRLVPVDPLAPTALTLEAPAPLLSATRDKEITASMIPAADNDAAGADGRACVKDGLAREWRT